MIGLQKAVPMVGLQFFAAEAGNDGGASETPVLTVAESQGPGDNLRLQMAVRGWTQPQPLLGKTISSNAVSLALSAVAPDVETAAASRPGEWFLEVPARVQSLAAVSDDALRAACVPIGTADEADPVRRAFSNAIAGTVPDLATMDEPVLRAMVNVNSWLGARWNLPFGPEKVIAAIASREMDANLARMTALPLVGGVHKQTLARLIDFVTAPAKGAASAIYLHSTGGGGKTTLLSFLQVQMLKRIPPIAVSRIDFDEPAIDPARTVTLNVALFEQLASSLTRLQERFSGVIPMLRRTAAAQRGSGQSGATKSRKWSAATKKSASGLKEESVYSESSSDQSSILYGILAPDTLGGPLVLVLDTAELVLTQNERAVAGIIEWFQFLQSEAHARDIRLIIAGRDPPPIVEDYNIAKVTDLISRLQYSGINFDPPVALPELNPAEANELLKNCGVKNAKLRRAAAAAVPGNPLLLRLTANALQQNDAGLVEIVHNAHTNAQIDRDVARNYLMRRIVAHVSDSLARPYVLAAMTSPVLTMTMLASEIIPGVDKQLDATAPAMPRSRSSRIFRSLAATSWLGRMALDGKSLTFNRDLRDFVLKLIAASPQDAAHAHCMHKALLAYHSPRRSAQGSALAVYHAAILGQPWSLPRNPATRRLLGEVFGELPSELQDALSGHTTEKAKPPEQSDPPESGASAGAERLPEADVMSDADWRLYLEGDAKRSGQGDQLIEDDRAAEALKLYRSRATRPPHLPPTFVIQALADLGECNSDEVDVAALVKALTADILHGGKSRINPDTMSRVYWVARFAMLKAPEKLTTQLLDLLKDVCDRVSDPGLTMLPALIAVAEALSNRQLMGARMLSSVRGHEAEGRIHLVRRMKTKAELPVSQIAVTQIDWFDQMRKSKLVNNAESLAWSQKSIEDLANSPIAAVNHAFAEMRRTAQINWDGQDMAGGVLLLRGQTTEFLRPLRERLAAVVTEQGGSAALHAIIAPVLRAMTIRPSEMNEKAFFERMEANSRAWLSALVSYADRCRLLPMLCAALADGKLPGATGTQAARIARSFLAWDHALCGGGTSAWRDAAS